MDAQSTERSRLELHATTGALALAAIVLVAVNLRPAIVSIGPVLPSIIEDFHLSHTTASLLVSIPDVLMGALALFTPWLARRFGRDFIILAALLVLFASTILRAFSTTTSELLAATAGVGVGIAIAGALVGGFIKARFPTRAALFMGIYAASLSLGSTLSAALTGPVAMQANGGWRLATGLWGGLGILAIGSWLMVTIAESRVGQPADTVQAHRLPFRNPTAWLIAAYFACINFLFYGLLSWSVPMYREAGLPPTVAGFALATFTAVFTLANPVFGWLSRSHDRRRWLALCASLSVAGLVPIAVIPASMPFAAIACCAFGLGGAFTLGMTLPLDNTDSVHEANVWNAFVLTVAYLIAAAGPLLVGHLRDINGDFRPSFLLLAAVAALMLLLTPFLHPHR